MSTIILGVETSCDDTGVALYHSVNGILSNVIYTQMHNEYGGVVPELASRDHIAKLPILLNTCIEQAGISMHDIDALAYTQGPGLQGCLLVGAVLSQSLAFSLGKPVIPVHHLEGHILSVMLDIHKPDFPFLVLLVSGGHTQIILAEQLGSYKIIGDTLDDAAGEAFDKTAKMLGLPYPGGAEIAQHAKYAKRTYNLPRPLCNSDTLDMSFSGLKTAALRLINTLDINDKQTIYDVAKSIEEAITDTLSIKIELAIKQYPHRRLVVCGGVSANLTLRQKLSKLNIELYCPPLKFCTDNAAMIAYTGFMHYDRAHYNYNTVVKPRCGFNDIS